VHATFFTIALFVSVTYRVVPAASKARPAASVPAVFKRPPRAVVAASPAAPASRAVMSLTTRSMKLCLHTAYCIVAPAVPNDNIVQLQLVIT
jgi:hypothetical protein